MEPLAPPATPLQDQLANISPIWVVAAVAAITLVRIALAKNKDAWARTVSETCDTINFVLVLAFLLIKPFVAQAFYIPSESMESTLLVQDRLIVNKFGYRMTQPERGDVVVFNAPPQATGGLDQDFIKRLIGKPGQTVQIKPPKIVLNGREVDYTIDSNDLHGYLRNRLNLQNDEAVKILPDGLLVNGTEKVSKDRLAELLGQPGASIELVPGTVYVDGKPLDEPYTREDPDYGQGGYNFEGGTTPIKLPADRLWVMGDNRNHSADSHVWGTLEKDRLVGKAVFVFFPFRRWGRIN